MSDKQQVGFGFSKRGQRIVDQPISYLMAKAIENPDLISLAAGLVDYETLPAEECSAILQDILGDEAKSRVALQYGTTEGFWELRQLLYEHLCEMDGVKPSAYPGSAAEVVVSTGSQQLLHMLADVMLDEHDVVIASWPSYFVYTGALAAVGATVRSVDIDEYGMKPECLERMLEGYDALNQIERVKMVYVVSYHQNPTGITLAQERKQQIVEIVKKFSKRHRILIVEDAAYRELTYEGEAPKSMKTWDVDNEYVAYLATFSKPFSPGLKTGYGLLPNDLIKPIQLNKGGRDFGSTNLSQHLIYEAMKRGVFAKHVERLKKAYKLKRDVMLEALEKYVGVLDKRIYWTKPSGGLYVWLTLPEGIDTGKDGKLFAAKMERGVIGVPGVYCYPEDPNRDAPSNQIRLSFGTATAEQVEEGVKRLGEAIAHILPKEVAK
ncbi:PLP-dependent aminotransferase family protein [Poriferisphaera sp. WC338]|uniref:aminotransferase-like domain-containing protein n=1 Tax=Poriferisphaera sp. WC338 TaxID=3425129 RepID=UPI003D816750